MHGNANSEDSTNLFSVMGKKLAAERSAFILQSNGFVAFL